MCDTRFQRSAYHMLLDTFQALLNRSAESALYLSNNLAYLILDEVAKYNWENNYYITYSSLLDMGKHFKKATYDNELVVYIHVWENKISTEVVYRKETILETKILGSTYKLLTLLKQFEREMNVEDGLRNCALFVNHNIVNVSTFFVINEISGSFLLE